MTTAKRLSEPNREDDRKDRLRALGLHALVARWDELCSLPWIDDLLELEEGERARRSLARRLGNARIGRFKPMADFDWSWPREIDREAVEDLLRLDFLRESANVVLLGPNGTGKTMIAQNIAYQALLQGETVRFTTASDLLHDLSSADGPATLARRMRRYLRPTLLLIDEVGYLSYSGRHADLLFDVVNRRNLERPTLVTTNRIFGEWNEVFPHSSCVVALVDRLVQRSEILAIDADSYRRKEADERAALKQSRKRPPRKTAKKRPAEGDGDAA